MLADDHSPFGTVSISTYTHVRRYLHSAGERMLEEEEEEEEEEEATHQDLGT